MRQQVDNVPPIAQHGSPLAPNPNPIGHRAAFRYNIGGNVLAIQSGRPGVSVSAVQNYIRRRVRGHRGFFMDPCLSTNALARIREGEPRKIEMRVARPNDLNHIDPNLSQVEDGLAALQEFVDGQTVNIGIGFERGDRHSILNLRRVLDLVGWANENRAQVEKMTIKIAEESDPIDVLAERLDMRGSVDLDPNDLDQAYEARIGFVRESFVQRQQELRVLYGVGG